MKRVFGLLLFFVFLVSCAPAPTQQALPTSTPTRLIFKPTFTILPLTTTPTIIVPTQTSTPEVCDPHTVDYCITDGHFIFQRPIKLPANTSIDGTYRFGSTQNGAREPHHGVEFENKIGTPVYAAADGVVVFAGPDKVAVYSPLTNAYGNLIVIKHANDLYTLYGHLSKILVEAGTIVSAGDEVGEVGKEGMAIGSHLHFEVRRGTVEDYFAVQNPELWLVPNRDASGQLLGVIQITVANREGKLVKRAEFTIQQQNENQPPGLINYGVTYSADMLKGVDENAAMGDLPPGKYRIALQYNGQLLDRWVEVESGKLTQVLFVVNE